MALISTGMAENGDAQHTATIKWFDRKKGFGFASPEEGGDDIFVHQLNLGNNSEGKRPFLDEGDTIYYDIGEHNGRPTAINVKLPPGKGLGAPRRRTRGRNAKKEADAELEDAETTAVDKAVEAEKATGDKPSENGHKPSGGRDGKTHRAGNNRPRRNDKGVAGPKPSRDGGKAPKADAAVNSTKMDDGSLATES